MFVPVLGRILSGKFGPPLYTLDDLPVLTKSVCLADINPLTLYDVYVSGWGRRYLRSWPFNRLDAAVNETAVSKLLQNGMAPPSAARLSPLGQDRIVLLGCHGSQGPK